MISGLYWKKISRQKVISLWIPSFSKSCFFWCEMVFALRFLYCDISVTDIPCISSLSSSRSFSDTLPGNDKWTVVPNSCRKTRKSHEFMNTPLSFIAVQYEWLPVDSWAHIRGNHKHQRCHTHNIPHYYQKDYLYLWCSLKNSYAKYLKKVITSQTQEIITQECNIKIQILIFGNKEVVGLFQYL